MMDDRIVYDPVDSKPMKMSEAYAYSEKDNLFFGSLETQQMYYHMLERGFEVKMDGTGKPSLVKMSPQLVWSKDVSLKSSSKDGHFVHTGLAAGDYTLTVEAPDLHGTFTSKTVKVTYEVTSSDQRQKIKTGEFMLEKNSPQRVESFPISLEHSTHPGAALSIDFKVSSKISSVQVIGKLEFVKLPEIRRELANARLVSQSVLQAGEYLVELTKGTTGVGMTLGWDKQISCCIIKTIDANGPAARTQKLSIGDRIQAIQGSRVTNVSFKEVIKLLRNVPLTVVLIMSRAPQGYVVSQNTNGRVRDLNGPKPARPAKRVSLNRPPAPGQAPERPRRPSTTGPTRPSKPPPPPMRGAPPPPVARSAPAAPPSPPQPISRTPSNLRQAPTRRPSSQGLPASPPIVSPPSPPSPPAAPVPPPVVPVPPPATTRAPPPPVPISRTPPPPVPRQTPPAPPAAPQRAGLDVYDGMKKAGIPEGAIRQTMMRDGVTPPPGYFDAPAAPMPPVPQQAPAPPIPQQAPAPPIPQQQAPAPPASSGAPAPPGFEKYVKMKNSGLPEGAILNSMRRDGVEPPPGFFSDPDIAQESSKAATPISITPHPVAAPPAASRNSAPPGGGLSLMDQLKAGKQLRKTEGPTEPAAKPAASAAPVNPLFEAIKKGPGQLKTVDPKELEEQKRKSAAQGGTLGAIAAALDARREQIASESDDEEWDDNDEWAM